MPEQLDIIGIEKLEQRRLVVKGLNLLGVWKWEIQNSMAIPIEVCGEIRVNRPGTKGWLVVSFSAALTMLEANLDYHFAKAQLIEAEQAVEAEIRMQLVEMLDKIKEEVME